MAEKNPVKDLMNDVVDMKVVEKRWQKEWENNHVFDAEPDKREKFFVTFPYPYINCSPHVGHAFSALKCDMIARFKRAKGFNTLFPIGLHATGEPIAGAAKRIAMRDRSQIQAFKSCGLSDKEIEKMKDPVNIVEFFKNEWINDFKALGMSVDWRRTFYTTYLNNAYNKFVTWQYNKLKKMGYVVQGSHPVIWCPGCKSPTGSHDRKEGENANVMDYVVIKFIMDDGSILPAATLRPETTYGVTNIWVKPDVEYVKAKVKTGKGNETWIISRAALTKLKEQKFDIKKIRIIKGKDLVGKYVKNPLNNNRLLVLPAYFVDTENATGVVMSVPSHAPYDWIALKELQEKPGVVSKYGVRSQDLEDIKPVTLIKTPDFPDMPGIDLVEKAGIKSQNEVGKLDKLTRQVYKREFHKGMLNENCGSYKGLMVRECKEKLTQDFIKNGFAHIMYETTEPVVCRCLTPCYVKVIENQWFIKYSDASWKNLTLECLEKCSVYPEEAKTWMRNAIINLKDKACARQSGLGTPIPWDKDWIIEPLSDSTIYMAYYIIAKYIRSGKIMDKHLTDEFFDHVFLGIGNAKTVAEKTKLDEGTVKRIRQDFEYWYPVDLRNSGKDLLSHHLIFFLYHHTAFFPKENWPRGVGANGWITVDGEKMSKSKGNFVTLKDALDNYGADASRLAFLDSGTGLDDADFRRESATNYKRKLEEFLKTIKTVLSKAKKRQKKHMDKWILSRVQKRIQATEEALERLDNSTGVQNAFWGMYNDIGRYLSRTSEPEQETLDYILCAFAKLVQPFAPHFAEELWHMLGNKTFVAHEKWPCVRKEFVDEEAERNEEALQKALEDIREIVKIVKKKPEKIYMYVIPRELDVYKELMPLIEKQFNTKVFVYATNDPNKHDPENKSSKAKPGKPGIYVE